ncbi:hypothetical protein J7297_04681 [Nakaseomyces glabratus]|nr:hypothetical protein J7297_04681 [Nakaseomyces glabratus]
MRKKQLSSTWIFYIIQLCYHLSLATSQAVVQSNTIVYGNNPPEYDNGYIVLGGAYLAFQDMTTVAMYDTVKVQKGGALYYLNNGLDGFNIISENHILGFFNFENNGTVVVDDRNSTTAGTWKIDNHLFSSSSFINTGSMMFTSSHGDTIEIGSEAVTNTGYIYSKGVSANMPQIFKIGNLANPWYNTGTICLANTSFDLENPIHGGGCITVGENSKFDIGGIDVQQQTVYLSDSTSVLKVTHGQDVRVYGLGNGNGFLTPLLAFESFKYDALTGILHATIGLADVLHISANIGKGYNSSLFEVVETFEFQGTKYTNYNYLRYNGKPPQKAPDICQPCVEVPSYTFEVPDSYETTNDLGFSETISFFSTYNENHLPMIGTTTIYTPPAVYTITKSDKRTTETDIVSRVTGIDNNNRPFTYYTTIKDEDQIKTIVTKYVTTTISEGKKTMWTTTMTELISNITTTDSNGKPTTIVTTYPSPAASGADYTTVITGSDSKAHTDIVSHITTTDSNGKPTTIVTTYPSPAASGADYTTTPTASLPPIVTTFPSPAASGADYTTVSPTGSDSGPHDIVSHITTTDSDGKPTTIVTTVPSPAASGADYTTVVSNSDGSVLTDIVSHITTTDSDGKPTTIVTTTPTASYHHRPTPPTIPQLQRRDRLHHRDPGSDGNGHRHRLPHHHHGLRRQAYPIVTTFPSPAAHGADYTTVIPTLTAGPTRHRLPHHHHTPRNLPPSSPPTSPFPSCQRRDYTTWSPALTAGPHYIVSHITTTDSDGKPTTIVTTVPSPAASGADYTTVVSNSDGSVLTDIVSHITTTDSDGKPTTIVTTVPSPAASGADYTTVVTNSDGRVHTDIVSHITTTDSNGKPTTIVTTFPSPAASGADYTTVITGSDGKAHTDIVSHITTTDSDGKLPPSSPTFPSPAASGADTPPPGADYTTVITGSDSKAHTDIVSHITTTDSNGKPTTIVTTYPSPAASGADYTTVITGSDSKAHTDIVSHITTTDSNGKPTTIVTTYPSPAASGADYTTVITGSDSKAHTDIVSHITTTDSNGKLITVVTTVPCTVCSSNADYTTVVTKSNGSVEAEVVSHITTTDSNGQVVTITTTAPCTENNGNGDYTTVVTNSNGSVETEVVSHITTTDSNGKPTTITTTAPCSDLESHVESQTTSPSMHTTSLVGSENGVSAKTVNDKPNPTSVTEVALSQGTTSNAGYSSDQGISLEMFAPTGASAVESGNKVSQTQTASIFHGAGSTFKIKFDTILLSTSLTILILLGMA